jgi:DNA gyrase/topoisomerase IV subunit B
MVTTKKPTAAKYTAANIKSLVFPESVRMNASQYIGGTDSYGIWMIVKELLDNGLDEALAGRNDKIQLFIDKDGSYWVSDAGHGVPQGITKTKIHVNGKDIINKMPTMQAVFGALNTSGKYTSEAYEVSIGTHGIGAKGTNATCDYFVVWTFFEGRWYNIEFKKGALLSPPAPCKAPRLPTGELAKKGTLIHCKPDKSIFSSLEFPTKSALEWAEIMSYFNPGVEIRIKSHRSEKVFLSKTGVSEYIQNRLVKLKSEAEKLNFVYKAEHGDPNAADVMVAFSNYTECDLRGYTNGSHNSKGGKHVDSVTGALYAGLKPFIKTRKVDGKQAPVFREGDLKEGLVGIVNAKLHKAKFNSQDKVYLSDERMAKPFEVKLTAAATKFFKENKALAQRLCERATRINEAKTKFTMSKKAAAELNKVKRMGLPAKYAGFDPRTKIHDRELFLTEGDSATGKLKEARFSYQGILPLKGKILNTLKDQKGKAMESEEIINILAAIGYDPKAADPMAKLTVGKIICMADPDPDGPLDYKTKVLLVDGTRKSIGDLAADWDKNQEPFWVWSLDSEGNVVPAKAHAPRVTTVVEKKAVVTFDDGTQVTCTLDHRWGVNYSKAPGKVSGGRKFVKTKNLKSGDSIASAYFERTDADGHPVDSDRGNSYYLSVVQPSGKLRPLHRLVVEATKPEKYQRWIDGNKNSGRGGAVHIHHKNEIKVDNRPGNLGVISRSKHAAHHAQEMALDYNGSAKHLQDLENFYSSKTGRCFKKQAAKQIARYNRSDDHREVVRQQNGDQEQIQRQQLGKMARTYLGLLKIKEPICQESWDRYKPKRNNSCASWDLVEPRLDEIEEYIERYELQPYDLVPKVGNEASYPAQKVTKFLNFCETLLNEGIRLSKRSYSEERVQRIREKLVPQGTPKWDTIFPTLGVSEKQLPDLVRERKGEVVLNHKVKSIKFIDCEPTEMYCLTVPTTGNFLISDRNGNGICSSNCHINSLLLTLFYKYLPELFERGMIYVSAIPEFYALYKGKIIPGATLSAVQKKIAKIKAPASTPVNHLKGWGEAPKQILRVMACEPATRRLIKIEPIHKDDHTEFAKLMNDDVDYRRDMLGLPSNGKAPVAAKKPARPAMKTETVKKLREASKGPRASAKDESYPEYLQGEEASFIREFLGISKLHHASPSELAKAKREYKRHTAAQGKLESARQHVRKVLKTVPKTKLKKAA